MKLKNLLFAFFALATIASCSTAYKSGQTPDDVYYSPVRVVEENSRQENNREVLRYDDYEDREIRMAMRDRRWRDINYDYGYDYGYSPYRYGYNYGYYYNPYYYNRPVFLPGYTIVNPKTTAPRTTNLGSYNNTAPVVVADSKGGQTRWVESSRTYSNSNSNSNGSGVGSAIRRVLTPTYSNSNSSGNNNSSNTNNTRTYSPSNSSPSASGSGSSGSSSSGSSSGTVTRPARGGN